MRDAGQRVLLAGCHGGVGRATRRLLEVTERGRDIVGRLDALLLLDRAPATIWNEAGAGELLPPSAIGSADDLARVVRAHGISAVVDLSSLDTVDCTRACDDLGSHYLSTSVEEWPDREPLPTDEAIARLLPPFRPSVRRTGHLIGAGANPGIVNALAFAAMDAFAERVGAAPSVESLELGSIIITEEDTTEDTTAEPEPSADVFAMTWHPEHCLEELFEPRAFVARGGRIVDLGHRPTERVYRARCGDRVIDGMAVPHEETVTLASRLANVEIAFVYRIPRAAREALAAHPERNRASAWRTRRLYPPHSIHLAGYDRLGVLLSSRRFGELWMGFHTDVAAGLRVGTNATQLQVATGVLAGLEQLGTRRGIHFVEDLDWRDFLDVVSELLGAPLVVHDASAPAKAMADRVVT